MGIDEEDTREFRTRPHPSTLSIGLLQILAPPPCPMRPRVSRCRAERE